MYIGKVLESFYHEKGENTRENGFFRHNNQLQKKTNSAILLDKVKIAWYNNKAVARERESRGQMNERKWKSGSGDRQWPVEFVQEKFT